jgi:hypothetical protein
MRESFKEKLERWQTTRPTEDQLEFVWGHRRFKERFAAVFTAFLFVVGFIPGQIICHLWLIIPGQVIVAIGSVKMWKAAGMKRCLPTGAKNNDPECYRGIQARLRSVLIVILGIALIAAARGAYVYLEDHGYEMRCLGRTGAGVASAPVLFSASDSSGLLQRILRLSAQHPYLDPQQHAPQHLDELRARPVLRQTST